MGKIQRYTPRRSNMQRRLKEIEEMRASLPLGQYLKLIHIGATTGVIPHVNPLTGEMAEIAVTTAHVEEDEPKKILLLGEGSVLDAQQRLQLLEYLVDKQMPAVSLQMMEAAGNSSEGAAAAALEDPSAIASTPRDELDQIITNAEFYLPNPAEPILPTDEQALG